MHKKEQSRYLGFFSFFALFALPGLFEGEWSQAVWLVWLVWLVYFFPQDKKHAGDEDEGGLDFGADPGSDLEQKDHNRLE